MQQARLDAERERTGEEELTKVEIRQLSSHTLKRLLHVTEVDLQPVRPQSSSALSAASRPSQAVLEAGAVAENAFEVAENAGQNEATGAEFTDTDVENDLVGRKSSVSAEKANIG